MHTVCPCSTATRFVCELTFIGACFSSGTTIGASYDPICPVVFSRTTTFTEKRPKSYWEVAQGSEYGFWANVNPAVSHPRWSQAKERVLGTMEQVPTQIWNGYGEYVAHLYAEMKGERLFA